MFDRHDVWHHARPNVLVVSDDPETRHRVAEALAPVAGSVELSHGARYALGRVHDGVDAVVIDLSVPQAWALLCLLRAADPGTMLVALTPSLDPAQAEEASALGASVVCHTSLPVEAMLRVSVLRARRQREAHRETVNA